MSKKSWSYKKFNKRDKMNDVSATKNSVASELLSLVQNLNKFDEGKSLKAEFFKILKNPKVHIKRENVEAYKTRMDKYDDYNVDLKHIQDFIVNIYLNYSGMGMKEWDINRG